MRSVRTILVACAAALCTVGVMSTPAFAKVEKEKHVFGKFVASTTGTTSGLGPVNKLQLGPYKFTGEESQNESGEDEFGPLCKSVKATGKAVEGENESLLQTIHFSHCVTNEAVGNAGEGLKHRIVVNFNLGIEFHSNHSATFGEIEPESATIQEGTVVFKGNSTCKVEIPSQTVPLKAGTEKGAESEFEAAMYATEEESLEGNKAGEKKFGPFRDRLVIETEFKHVKSTVPLNKSCFDTKFGESKNYNDGVIDLEFERITLKNGNLSFVPATDEA
jgi:hypothetical protein